MMNSSALLQLQVKESQLKPTYENKRNFIIYITMISRGASGFRHGAARNSGDLTWTSLVLLGSLCVILPTGIWSVRWPPVAWDCHLPSLAVPTDRAFVGLNIHLSAPEKLQVDSLWPHMWWIVTGAQGMGSSGANSLGHTIEGHAHGWKPHLGLMAWGQFSPNGKEKGRLECVLIRPKLCEFKPLQMVYEII